MWLIYGQENSLPKNILPFDLKSFIDSNFGSNSKGSKLVIGYCFFFAHNILS